MRFRLLISLLLLPWSLVVAQTPSKTVSANPGTGELIWPDKETFKLINGIASGMSNPMTAPGDLIVGGIGGAPARLGIGLPGYVLAVNLTADGLVWIPAPTGGGGGGTGTVTSFSAGGLAPLFTTSVATPTTTPALSFSLSSQAANRFFAGPASGGSAAPTMRAIVPADVPDLSGIYLTPGAANAAYVPVTRTVNGHPLSANVVVTKGDVGLGNVDNTSDLDKPISTATQTALDAKVTANAGIVGATKTKITYDAKGLITTGADATTADIADSSNKRYVTDAQLVVLGNTSGTNTGDQTSVTGNAGTATALQTARTIGGVSFDGTANIVPETIAVVDSTDATSSVLIVDSATGNLQPKTDAGLTYNATTGVLTATGFAGPLTGNVTGNVSGSSGSTTGNAATATALQTARAIYGNNFDGSASLTQIIASTYGGTGNGFTKFTGPTTSEKTFSLPNANAVILTDAAAVTAAQGGTGQTSYTTGDLLYASSSSALSKRSIGSTNAYLTISGGLPAWSANTLSLGGNVATGGALTISGAFSTTITVTGATTVTLPTTGTLSALGGTNTWSGVNTYSNTTDSSSSTTGAIVTAGGLGVAKALVIGTNLAIGTTSAADSRVTIGGTIPVSSNVSRALNVTSLFDSTAASTLSVNVNSFVSLSGSGTIAEVAAFRAAGITAGTATATYYIGFVAQDTAGATNIIGFRSLINAGSNKWGIYSGGSASNYFAGETYIGSVTDLGAYILQVTGNAVFTGTLTKPGGTSPLITTNTAITSGSGAATGTLTNAPSAGDPSKWVPINDNGTTRYIPAW